MPKAIQVKHISDQEVLDACTAFWHQMHAIPSYRRLFEGYADTQSLVPIDVLAAKYPYKVVLRKMEQMVARDLLEYGTTIHTAWPVDYDHTARRSINATP